MRIKNDLTARDVPITGAMGDAVGVQARRLATMVSRGTIQLSELPRKMRAVVESLLAERKAEPEQPADEMDINDYNVTQLKALAKERGIAEHSSMKKAELLEVLSG